MTILINSKSCRRHAEQIIHKRQMIWQLETYIALAAFKPQILFGIKWKWSRTALLGGSSPDPAAFTPHFIFDFKWNLNHSTLLGTTEPQLGTV